jgi:tetratricopeptide (TPR) repeat protein
MVASCAPSAVARRRILLVAALLALRVTALAQGIQSREALEAYRAGTRSHDLGRYEEAVGKFEEAYRLGGDARSLFNIGQSYFKAGRHQQARTAYESYLRELPAASNRALVEERLVEIEGGTGPAGTLGGRCRTGAARLWMRARTGLPHGTRHARKRETSLGVDGAGA